MTQPALLSLVTRRLHSHSQTSLHVHLLENLWGRYALPPPQGWRRATSGYTSETWVIQLRGGRKVVLRRYPSRFPEARIRFEHSILRYLQRHRFPAPGVIPTSSEESFIEVDGRAWAVFEYCQGSMAPRPLLRQADINTTGARTLARYHQLMADFQPDGQELVQGLGHRWYLEELDRYREHVSSGRSLTRVERYFLKHVGDIRHRLATLGALLETSGSRCSKTIIHGDFGFENILFRNGQVVGVLDFTNAHLDARVADVAYSLLACSKWLGARLNLATARMFLKAYQARYPLSREELELVPLWMTYNRLRSLCWNIMKYDTEGWPEMPARFAEGLRLVRWMDAHESSLQAVCRAAL